jgi:hypothetical protein
VKISNHFAKDKHALLELKAALQAFQMYPTAEGLEYASAVAAAEIMIAKTNFYENDDLSAEDFAEAEPT